jgi:hypothetical protein
VRKLRNSPGHKSSIFFGLERSTRAAFHAEPPGIPHHRGTGRAAESLPRNMPNLEIDNLAGRDLWPGHIVKRARAADRISGGAALP